MNISNYFKTAISSLLAATTGQTSKSVAATGVVTLGLASNPVLPGTGSVTVPIGTTAQRPGTPVEGMLRYNTQTDELEVYKASAWKTVTTSA
jgi:hypothetical protein